MSRVLHVLALLLPCLGLSGCFGSFVEDDRFQEWITHLRDGDEHARAEAALLLGGWSLRDPERVPGVVAALEEALRDPSASVVEMAVQSLGAYGKHAASALPELLRLAAVGDAKLRSTCWRAIPRLGPVARPAIREALADPNPRRRRDVVLGLGLGHFNLGGSVWVPRRPSGHVRGWLIAACRDDDAQVRTYAMFGLGVHRIASRPALAALIRGLGDGNLGVRFSAVQALGCIGPPARSAAPHLRAMLRPSRDLKPWLLELHEEPRGHLRRAIDRALRRLRG